MLCYMPCYVLLCYAGHYVMLYAMASRGSIVTWLYPPLHSNHDREHLSRQNGFWFRQDIMTYEINICYIINLVINTMEGH